MLSIDEYKGYDEFLPAPEVSQWINAAFLDESGPLFCEDHASLAEADIACLWSNSEYRRRGRRIVGQAELGEGLGGRVGGWKRDRALQQIYEWFDEVPDFLITLDAIYADSADDAEFCALVDHELYHCVHDTDRFGMPKFNQRTGKPMWAMRGHDVEEFVGVVRRFGIEAAGQNAVDMVIAASKKPAIAPARLAQACGTCLAKRAA